MSRFGAKSTSALLEKVNSKLRGEDTKQTNDDDGLQAYLSGLNKTSKVQTVKKSDFQWDKFDEVSDPSLEDEPLRKKSPEVGTAGSKFLKKKQPEVTSQKDGTRKGIQSTQKSKALSKVSGLGNKYENKTKPEAVRLSGSDVDFSFNFDGQILGDVDALTPAITPRHEKSVSEDSTSFGKKGSKFMKKPSKAEESHSPVRQTSIEKPKTAPQQKPTGHYMQEQQKMNQDKNRSATQANSQNMTHKPSQWPSLQQKRQQPVTFDIDEESSSMSLGKGGAKFMKKKPVEKKPSPVQSPKEQRKSKESLVKLNNNEKQRDVFALKTSEKYSTTVRLDSDEESLQGFIHDLASSPSDLSLKSPPKSPKTPRGILKTPRTPHSVSATPLEDIHEEEKAANTTLSEEDSFKSDDSLASTVIDIRYDSSGWTTDDFGVNLLDFDALAPAEISPPEEKPIKSKETQKSDKSKNSKKNDDKRKSKSNESKSSSKKNKTKKQKSTSFETTGDDIFAEMGLFTVDDLLGKPQMYDDSGDDIGTDIEREEVEEEDMSYGGGRSPSPLRSILSPSPKLDRTPRSSRTRVHYSLKDDLAINLARSPSPEVISTARGSKTASVVYTDDFDDVSDNNVIRTEEPSEVESVSEYLGNSQSSYTGGFPRSKRHRSDSEYYSDDFVSATESRWSAKRREYARSESADSEYSVYSDTFSEMSESRTDTLTNRKSRRSRAAEKEVQTGNSLAELTYRWQPQQSGVAYVTPGYGLQDTDPKLVATHVVSADALEAMTTYSPSVLALNEMLRQQLQLTENYVNVQKTLYQSLLQTTQPDYVYTTLEDTKQYIKKHRKPKLTFDDALRQVKRQMGLDK